MVQFKMRPHAQLDNFLKEIPRGGLRVALDAFVEYVVGDTSHGLRHDEPQKYVSRRAAGYKTSAAQMRFFFATGILTRGAGGKITLNHYKRTGETAAAWSYKPTNNGYGYTITNNKPGAYYTRDNDGQSTQHEMAGRRKVVKVIADNVLGAIRHANAEIKKWIAGKGMS